MSNSGERCNLDEKGKRQSPGRPCRRKKRVSRGNQHTKPDSEDVNGGASAKKMNSTKSFDIIIDRSHGYVILNFISGSAAISSYVKCKTCDSDIRLLESHVRGSGSTLVLKCNKCEQKSISSSPFADNQSYELNSRFTLAMRLLGNGLTGVQSFAGIMDLPKCFCQSTYDKITKNIRNAAEVVAHPSMQAAVEEERRLTGINGNVDERAGIIVSGDGTWRKRGASSLQGAATLIRILSGEVVDFIAKSSFCKMYRFWEDKEETEEYYKWYEGHAPECIANHEGSSGTKEVDEIVEMFARSEQLHGTKYLYYVVNGDTTTYKSVTEARPYGDIIIKKKECIGQVQKRKKKQNKGPGEKGKLTAKLIDELTVYYGLAIPNNCKSIADMKKSTSATYYYKCSTALLARKVGVRGDQQKPEALWIHILNASVPEAIRPVYEALSSDELLEKCLGGFAPNNHENLYSKIWKIAPKISFSGNVIVEIITRISASTFNDGANTFLQFLTKFNVVIGPNAVAACETLVDTRLSATCIRCENATKEARVAGRNRKKDAEDAVNAEEGPSYSAGLY